MNRTIKKTVSSTRVLILVFITFLFSGLISPHIAFAKSNLTDEDEAMFSQNDILFYEPCDAINNDKGAGVCGDNKNYAGEQVFTDEQMKAIEAHQPFYQKAADQYGISWEIIAVIHKREHGLAKSNPANGQGVYQFYSASERASCKGGDFTPGKISDEQFQIQTNCVAKKIKEGYGAGLDLNTDNGVKKMFFKYNGMAQAYINQALKLGFSQEEAENGEGSPYVMNRYDAKREPSATWGQIKTDGGSIEYPANSDFGAFVFYKAIACGEGGSETSDSCNGGEKGSKNINAAAVSLAWPFETDKKIYTYQQSNGLQSRDAYNNISKWTGGKATDAFNKAIDEVYPNRKWSQCPRIGASCDVFVGTSIRYSGYDKDWPRGLGSQINHVKEHSDLWEYISDGHGIDPQPGDVVNTGTHTYIVVQDEDGTFYRAEAGLCHYFGRISRKFKGFESGAKVFRAKQAKNSTVGVSVKNGVTASSTTGTISGNSTPGSGDINASAFALSWPVGTPESTSKSTAYDKFVEYFNSLGGHQNTGGQQWQDGKSCSMFVNTVLLHAGAVKGKKVRSPGAIADYFLEHEEDWNEIEGSGTGDLKYSDLQPGDTLVYYSTSPYGSGNESKYNWRGLHTTHVAIYVETDDGSSAIAEAHFERQWGHVDKKDGNKKVSDKIRVFRWKHNKNGMGGCNICGGQNSEGDDVSLKDGGLSMEEAKKLVDIYKGYAGENNLRGNVAIANKYYIKVGCHGNLFLNCPSFVKYFVNRYTSKKWTSGLTGDGRSTYKYLANALNLQTGSSPRPYAVFSDDSYSPGHTGVVLGVDSSKGTMIIGEAGCMSSSTAQAAYNFIGAHEVSIKKYHLYTYLDPIINLSGT